MGELVSPRELVKRRPGLGTLRRLRGWRERNIGPSYHRINSRVVYYDLDAVDQFLESCRVETQSTPARSGAGTRISDRIVAALQEIGPSSPAEVAEFIDHPRPSVVALLNKLCRTDDRVRRVRRGVYAVAVRADAGRSDGVSEGGGEAGA